jgi:hypothetical protein
MTKKEQKIQKVLDAFPDADGKLRESPDRYASCDISKELAFDGIADAGRALLYLRSPN